MLPVLDLIPAKPEQPLFYLVYLYNFSSNCTPMLLVEDLIPAKPEKPLFHLSISKIYAQIISPCFQSYTSSQQILNAPIPIHSGTKHTHWWTEHTKRSIYEIDLEVNFIFIQLLLVGCFYFYTTIVGGMSEVRKLDKDRGNIDNIVLGSFTRFFFLGKIILKFILMKFYSWVKVYGNGCFFLSFFFFFFFFFFKKKSNRVWKSVFYA